MAKLLLALALLLIGFMIERTFNQVGVVEDKVVLANQKLDAIQKDTARIPLPKPRPRKKIVKRHTNPMVLRPTMQ